MKLNSSLNLSLKIENTAFNSSSSSTPTYDSSSSDSVSSTFNITTSPASSVSSTGKSITYSSELYSSGNVIFNLYCVFAA